MAAISALIVLAMIFSGIAAFTYAMFNIGKVFTMNLGTIFKYCFYFWCGVICIMFIMSWF